MVSHLWRRRVAAFVVAAVLSPAAVTSNAFAQSAPDAKASLADADKAAKAKDWATAARLFDAANKAQPSEGALDGLANAYYQSGQFGDAFSAYTEWTEKYGAKTPAKKKTADARLKELENKTAPLTIVVSEPGAAISVDDKPVATSPTAGPLRLTIGARRIRVSKDGFTPFDAAPNLAANTPATLDVKLVSASAKGKVVVKEKTGKAIRVTIDGVDMGEAPWTGEVDPGPHDVGARGVGLAAVPQKVNVERGKTQEIVLVASSSTAPVKLATNDSKGLIYLDDKLVGEGSFVGDIPSGAHRLKVTREGYDPFEEELVVKDKEPLARTITLKLNSKIDTGPMVTDERLEGLYGGFSALFLTTPGGTGNDIEKRLCDNRSGTPELLGCEAPDGMGGGFGGFIGYHWDPIGMELFVAAQYDQRTMKTDWAPSSTDPGIGPDPARTEEYKLRRLGGMGLARVRLTLQSKRIRFTLAAGAGFARREMFLTRDTFAKDNADRDKYVSETAGYWSPIVSFEPSIMYRLTPTAAVALGVQMFLDAPNTIFSGNDGQNPHSNKESFHRLGQRPLATNELDLASNIQIFIGPYLGMMFGP